MTSVDTTITQRNSAKASHAWACVPMCASELLGAGVHRSYTVNTIRTPSDDRRWDFPFESVRYCLVPSSFGGEMGSPILLSCVDNVISKISDDFPLNFIFLPSDSVRWKPLQIYVVESFHKKSPRRRRRRGACAYVLEKFLESKRPLLVFILFLRISSPLSPDVCESDKMNERPFEKIKFQTHAKA